MNILVVGQSHVAAIRAAAKARREADPARARTRTIHTLEPHYAPEFDGEGFSAPLADAIRDQIDRHRPLVASAMGGNVHNALALLAHPRPFDFHLSGEPSPPPDPDAEPIAETLVTAALQAARATDRRRLALLAAVAGPFVHLESPPPVADAAWVAAQADAYFRGQGGGVPTIAPPALRHRVWRLHARLVRAEVEALGGRVLPVPSAVLDAAGFLDPAFAGDATHGNAAYGEAVLAALERSA
jgi:hypothetical protein